MSHNILVRTGPISAYDILSESQFHGTKEYLKLDTRDRIDKAYALALADGVDSLYDCYVVTISPEDMYALKKAYHVYEGFGLLQ